MRQASLRIRFNWPTPAIVFGNATEPSRFAHFWQGIPCACHAKRHLKTGRPKVLRTNQFLTLLTSKCASRHDGVHFFIISTSKSAPRMVCFVRFDFEMCFAPQRHAMCHLSSPPNGSAPATLASLLFEPPEPQIIGTTMNNTVNRDFSTFRAPASSFL